MGLNNYSKALGFTIMNGILWCLLLVQACISMIWLVKEIIRSLNILVSMDLDREWIIWTSFLICLLFNHVAPVQQLLFLIISSLNNLLGPEHKDSRTAQERQSSTQGDLCSPVMIATVTSSQHPPVIKDATHRSSQSVPISPSSPTFRRTSRGAPAGLRSRAIQKSLRARIRRCVY